jgi:multidrug efflux pump subunit AcrA (membrane-fusion protein)
MGRRLRLIVVIAGAAAALTLGIRPWRARTVPVTAATVHAGPLEVGITTNGVVEPTDPHQLRAPAAAFVRAVNVVEGQAVTKGTVLMTLDFAQQRADLARAREDLATAQRDLRSAEGGGAADERAQIESDLRKTDAEAAHLRKEHDTLTRLIATKAATRQELDQVNLDLARAEATHAALTTKLQELGRQAASGVQARQFALERARQTIRMLETQVAFETLRAPADGTVYSLPVRSGSRVETGDLLAAVGDLGRMQVRAFVDEPELASIQKGQPVQISWSAVANRVWTGHVERLPGAVVVRGERHVGEVICSLDHSMQLIPNLDVDVRIRVQSRPRALLVPRQAVMSDQAGPYVFVIENGTVHRRPIVIDVASVADDAILSGLKEGDVVAIPGSADLSDGMRVTITSRTP